LQRPCINYAELQLLNDSIERRSCHGFQPGLSAADRVMMQPKPAAIETDAMTLLGLRLMRSFLKLRDGNHREQLVALAERLVREEEDPAKIDD
jgi:hypothetical protein